MAKKKPHFMQAGEAARLLGVNQLRLANRIPHLLIPKKSTKLYYSEYIDNLAANMNRRGATVITTGLAGVFWRTALARNLTAEGEAWLTEQLPDRRKFSPRGLGTILGVTEATVTNWIRSDVFDKKALVIEGSGPSGTLIPAPEIKKKLIWIKPDA